MITDTSLIDRTIYVDLVLTIIEIQRPTVLRHELCMQWEGCESENPFCLKHLMLHTLDLFCAQHLLFGTYFLR